MMVQNIRRSIVDFTDSISKRADNFTGREWVFKAIDDWLIDMHGPRFFLLEGEPGSGKTAIAARLSQISQGAIAQQDLTALTRNVISAVYFCDARDTKSIDPLVFVNSVATQLANRYPDYLALVNRQSEDPDIHITVQQNVQQVVSGQVVGVIINVNAPAPESAFNRAVREPLEILLRTKPDEHVVILVDALDEALTYSGKSNIVALLARTDGLSSHVRFILTTRPEEQVTSEFTKAKKLLLSIPHDQRSQEDISRYVQLRLRDDSLLAEKVAQADPDQVARLTEVLPLKADGNFQFVRFLLDSIATGLRGVLELEGLPTGLDELYFDSLRRVVQLKGRDWFTTYRLLLGILVVAQESLTIAQLQAFTLQSEETVRQYLGDLQQFIEEVKSQDEKGTLVPRHRLFHQSFHDFLHSQSVVKNDEHVRNSYFLSKIEWHKAMAASCEGSDLTKIWEEARHLPLEQARREYARRYYITHLYLANEWQRLFAVLDEGQYGHAKERYDLSTRSYIQDLDRGCQAAMNSGATLEEQISMLPYLWRYSLLRGSLRSVANDYPQETLQLLLLLGREAEVLGYAELLTDPYHKVKILLMIGHHMATRVEVRDQILFRAVEVARSIGDGYYRVLALIPLASELTNDQHWEVAAEVWKEAEQIAQSPSVAKAALFILVSALAKAQQWKQAAEVARSMEYPKWQAENLLEIAKELAKAQQWKQAMKLWKEAEKVARSITFDPDKVKLDELLSALANELAKARYWKQADEVARSIYWHDKRVLTLGEIASALAEDQQWEQAVELWKEVEELARSIILGDWVNLSKTEAFEALVSPLAKIWQWWHAAEIWKEVEELAHTIRGEFDRVKVLCTLASALAEAQQNERAVEMWKEAEQLAHSVKYYPEVGGALEFLAHAMIKAQQLEKAIEIARSIKDFYHRDRATEALVDAFSGAQQWERAEGIARSIEESNKRVKVLNTLASAMVKAGYRKQAEKICVETESFVRQIPVSSFRSKALSALASALTKAQQWELATEVARSIQERDEQSQTLLTLACALVEAQQWEQAAEIVRSIQNLSEPMNQGYARTENLRALASALVKARQREQATEIWKEVEKKARKDHQALLILVSELAKAQQWKQAAEIACSLPSKYEGAEALRVVVSELAKAQQWKQAAEIARSIGYSRSGDRATALLALASELTKAQQWEQAAEFWKEAEKAARSFERDLATSDYGEKCRTERNRAMDLLVRSLTKGQRWKQAAEIARSLERGDEQRVIALGVLASELTKAQQWEQAAEFWKEAEEAARSCERVALYQEDVPFETYPVFVKRRSSNQDYGLSLLGRYLVEAQQWEHAIRLVRYISNSDLRVLTSELAEAQQWQQAIEIARSIRVIDERAETLVVLASALTKAQQFELAAEMWKEVEKIAQTLLGDEKALMKVTATLLSAKEYQRLVQIIQFSWRQIETNDDAFRLFPLALDLLPLSPNLSIAFYRGLQWVDAFLRGEV